MVLIDRHQISKVVQLEGICTHNEDSNDRGVREMEVKNPKKLSNSKCVYQPRLSAVGNETNRVMMSAYSHH